MCLFKAKRGACQHPNPTQPNQLLFNSFVSQIHQTLLLAVDTTLSCSGFWQVQPDATCKPPFLRWRRRRPSSLPMADTALAASPLFKPAALRFCAPPHTDCMLPMSIPCFWPQAAPCLLHQRVLFCPAGPHNRGGHCMSPAPPFHHEAPSLSSILARSLKLWFKLQPLAPSPAEDMVRNDHSEV